MYKIDFAGKTIILGASVSDDRIGTAFGREYEILGSLVKQFIRSFTQEQIAAIIKALPASVRLDVDVMVAALSATSFDEIISDVQEIKLEKGYLSWLKSTYVRLNDEEECGILSFEDFCDTVVVENEQIIETLKRVGIEVDDAIRAQFAPTEDAYYDYCLKAFDKEQERKQQIEAIGEAIEIYGGDPNLFQRTGFFTEEEKEISDWTNKYYQDNGLGSFCSDDDYDWFQRNLEQDRARRFPNLAKVLPDCALDIFSEEDIYAY